MTALVHDPPAHAEMPQMHEEPRFVASLDLVALPSAISVTRLFISDTLYRWRWRAMFIEPELEAVAAELVALAVKATGPKEGTRWADINQLNPIKLRLLGFERHIGIEVADTGRKMLTPPEDVDLRDDTGPGLIDARSRTWGSYPTPRGRVLWADFAVYERTTAGLPVRPRRPSPHPRASRIAPASQPTTADLLSRLLDGLRRL
jgi:hypothetical protein